MSSHKKADKREVVQELTTKGKEVVAAYQNLVHKLESVIESDQHLINQL